MMLIKSVAHLFKNLFHLCCSNRKYIYSHINYEIKLLFLIKKKKENLNRSEVFIHGGAKVGFKEPYRECLDLYHR